MDEEDLTETVEKELGEHDESLWGVRIRSVQEDPAEMSVCVCVDAVISKS